MRKQYHFRPSENGYYAWDVDKLIEASKTFPVVSVSLDDIKDLDENFWYNGENDVPSGRSIAHHVQLIHEADQSYPVILTEGNRVMDGMHRIVKALTLGHKTLKAVIIDKTPPPDFKDVQADDLSY